MPLDTPTDQQLLISCLCVTENRPAFMPWLLWCFDRQRWPRRELVIVDSSAEPFTAGERDDVRVLSAPSGMGVAAKRNLALEAAQGDIITWFDDDDWQHPDRLTLLADALAAGAP
ncbi:MAG: glycosyltransferase family 2 protein, partial [Anaerolineae bacterium]|nr:glycosyltransferase family 2 protein [Anaerolineae bacterium]